MSEKDLAVQLQAEKDDMSQWEEVVPTKRGKRKLSAMVSVRLSPEELEHVQKRAEESGQSVSAYLRNLALRDAARGASRHGLPGLVVQVSGGHYASVVRRPQGFSQGFLRRPASAIVTTSAG